MALRKYRKALHYLDECWEKDGIDEGDSLASLHSSYHFSSILKSDTIISAEKSAALRKVKSQIFTNSSVSGHSHSFGVLSHF